MRVGWARCRAFALVRIERRGELFGWPGRHHIFNNGLLSCATTPTQSHHPRHNSHLCAHPTLHNPHFRTHFDGT